LIMLVSIDSLGYHFVIAFDVFLYYKHIIS